ncbi:MAG: DsbE family thiol:disulfide interchange protein [Pseudomonadota bacterium]
MKRIWAFLPLLMIVVLGGFLGWGLNPNRDPSEIPSALVGKPLPEMVLPALAGIDNAGFVPADIAMHDLALVNVFASWCVPCRAEHGPLSELAAREGLALYGLNYRDQQADAVDWLNELGNPYLGIGHDEAGRAGIEWGISGVPETFILVRGTIVHRHVGPLVGEAATRPFLDALQKARMR